jgi:hypothetical protein
VTGVSTIGLDIAKLAFQVHGADASGHVLFRKKIVCSQLFRLGRMQLILQYQGPAEWNIRHVSHAFGERVSQRGQLCLANPGLKLPGQVAKRACKIVGESGDL